VTAAPRSRGEGDPADNGLQSMTRRFFRRFSIAGVLLALAVQLIPFGHAHTNPPVSREPAWDSPQTKALVQRACYDCHSNETVWPWYSHVAPVSWLVQRDVDGGRRHLNFSEWDRPHRHDKDVVAQVQSGEMPPWFYLPMHASARLTEPERAALLAGAARTFGSPAIPDRGGAR
jgi:hypothetical protein